VIWLCSLAHQAAQKVWVHSTDSRGGARFAQGEGRHPDERRPHAAVEPSRRVPPYTVAVTTGHSLSRIDVAALLFVAINLLSGFLDDWLKERKHRNDGLLGYQKILIQTLAAALFFAVGNPELRGSVNLGATVLLSGWWFFVIAMV